MSGNKNYTRRTVLGTLTTSTAIAVAGCGGSSESTPTATAEESSAETDEAMSTETEGEMSTETDPYMNGVGPDASVAFDVPSDGATLSSTSVQWAAAADGVTIEESGAVTEGAGHYHIMVDTEAVEPGETIPGDDAHIHYGTGQSDGVLELEPGDHTLQLQVGDGEHTAMGLTDSIDVTVADEATLDLETTVDGSEVEWAVTAQNYTVEPSSEGINSNAGHLHAIIDTDPVPVGDVIPGDANHVHFGDGSTSGTLDLADQLGDAYEAGEHTIHFQVGSGSHRATAVRTETTVTTE